MTDLFRADDPATEKHLRMLSGDLIAWFTSIGSDGAPRAVPVWFFWHDGRISILSEPDTVKVANVKRDPRVLVHLNAGGPHGDDVLVLRGTVEVVDGGASDWIARHHEPYEEKYREAIAAYGTPLERFAETFSTLIVFTPERVLGW
ncbi:pyridoxamine 5'-phosphate oxidase family protein [Microbacterium sp. 18062]|uniref:pyridoxamine 5'-phosphate oxidase family protein n=1 Tax=Microbacterium sp. 18062 TaxID=2681410 RepID=UPI001356FD1D|nr:pyridoxamine 5'-phosphate oxidase family protein [Microbacterium sp. 18062]